MAIDNGLYIVETGTWIPDPDTINFAGLTFGTHYIKVQASQAGFKKSPEIKLSQLPLGLGMVSKSGKRSTVTAFSGWVSSLDEMNKCEDFLDLHTYQGDKVLCLILKLATGSFKTFKDNTRTTQKYLRGELLDLSSDYKAAECDVFSVSGTFESRWGI